MFEKSKLMYGLINVFGTQQFLQFSMAVISLQHAERCSN